MLSGRKVNLRALEQSDLEKEFAWWNDNELLDRTDGSISAPVSRIEFEKTFLENFILTKETSKWFAIETKKGEFIGDIGLSRIDWKNRNALVAISIGEEKFRGKAYGTDALKVFLSFAFLELGVHRIEIGCYEFNQAAIHCFEKCGFRKEGRQRDRLYRDGRFWDSINYGLLKDEWERRIRR